MTLYLNLLFERKVNLNSPLWLYVERAIITRQLKKKNPHDNGELKQIQEKKGLAFIVENGEKRMSSLFITKKSIQLHLTLLRELRQCHSSWKSAQNSFNV